ncbi:MAG: hypothetical protein K0Q59_5569 [Paenibacillus sp.]|nr:hypothetical protein [Paenibacillus sp.]
MVISISERIRGGFWGLLVADAVGVPYEFHDPDAIPPYEQIEMEPPVGFQRSYPHIKPGTWSDDGAQALCLLDSLLRHDALDVSDFARRIAAWEGEGLWAVDGLVFDVGIQTQLAIAALNSGTPPSQSGYVNPQGKGNGALMRVLPLALRHEGSDGELIRDAHAQAVVTHGHLTNQICCALYCLWARRMLQGDETVPAYVSAVATLKEHYSTMPEYMLDLANTVKPDDEPVTDGSGYVVATLNAARIALRQPSYEAVVKKAIQFGHDTDTNAAVAGGLAGIRDGMEAIPTRWLEKLRGKPSAEPLLETLVKQKGKRP